MGKENIASLIEKVRPLLKDTATRQSTIDQITRAAGKIANPDTMTSSVKANTSVTGKFGGARLFGYQARNLRLLAEEIESTGATVSQANNNEIKLLYESAAHATLRSLTHCGNKPPLPHYTNMRLYIEEQVKPLFTHRRKYGLSEPLLNEIEKELKRITADTTSDKTSPHLYLGSTEESLNRLWN